MNIYTTIVIVTAIIAICYLANLYTSVSNWKEDKANAIKKMDETNHYLFKIWAILDDFKDVHRSDCKDTISKEVKT